MSKGSYNIYNPVNTNATRSKNTFAKSLFCSLLVLGVIALVLFLIALPLKNDEENFEIDIRGNAESLEGKEQRPFETARESDVEVNAYLTKNNSKLSGTQNKFYEKIIQYNNEDTTTDGTQTEIIDVTFKQTVESVEINNEIDVENKSVSITPPIDDESNETISQVNADNNNGTTNNGTDVNNDKIIFPEETQNDTVVNDVQNTITTTPRNKVIEYYDAINITNMVYDGNRYCISNACKRVSAKILSTMSTSEEPCSNYYNYACEGVSMNYIQENENSKNIYRKIKAQMEKISNAEENHLIMFKNYYKSCVNYEIADGLRKMNEAFESFGYKFIDEKADTNEIPKLETLLVDLLKQNFAALFDVKVDSDPQSPNNLVVSLEPVFYEDFTDDFIGDYNKYEKICIEDSLQYIEFPNTTLDEFYLHYKNCYKSRFIGDVRRALRVLGVFTSLNNANKTSNQIQNLLFDFEQLIINEQLNIDVPERMRIRRDKNYELLKLSHLKADITGIDWSYILSSLLNDYEENGSMVIQVYHLNYLNDMMLNIDTNMMSPTNANRRRKQHNSILALYAYKLFKDYVLDQTKVNDRPDYCVRLTTKMMNDVSSALYIKSFSKRQMDEMNSYAKNIFYEISQIAEGNISAIWMSHRSSRLPENSTKLLTVKENKPWTNDTELEERYNMANITVNDFIKNTIKLEKRYRNLLYSSLNKHPLSPNILWTVLASPLDTKPSHIWFEDQGYIVLPLAVIASEISFRNLPSYISMSSLGYKLAKEMMNYFYAPTSHSQSLMRTFNKNVSITLTEDLINPESIINFNVSTSSRDLLSSVYGAMVTYEAYLESKSQNPKVNQRLIWQNSSVDQLFILHLSQQYCKRESILDNPLLILEKDTLPPMLTVNSILINNEKFEELYYCPKDSLVSGISLMEIDPSNERSSFDG